MTRVEVKMFKHIKKMIDAIKVLRGGRDDHVESNRWLAELRNEKECMSTYSPLNSEDQTEFDEPMAKVTIIAPLRILAPMTDDLFG
jgi:hypothetical protein